MVHSQRIQIQAGASTSFFFTHQKVFIELKITRILPSELVNTVEPLKEYGTLLVTIIRC